MTHLRKIMLEELERRNYAQTTIECYIQLVALPFLPSIILRWPGRRWRCSASLTRWYSKKPPPGASGCASLGV